MICKVTLLVNKSESLTFHYLFFFSLSPFTKKDRNGPHQARCGFVVTTHAHSGQSKLKFSSHAFTCWRLLCKQYPHIWNYVDARCGTVHTLFWVVKCICFKKLSFFMCSSWYLCYFLYSTTLAMRRRVLWLFLCTDFTVLDWY